MTCLTENVVVELVEGLLAPAERAPIHAHLHDCAACRRLVSAVARLADEIEGSGSALEWLARGAPARHGWLPRGTSIDRYVVLEQVGAGSAGTVYAAYDPDLDRRVALKLLRTTGDDAGGAGEEGRRAALLREAKVMARLSHPNVITVHDVGVTDGGVFVAMEFIDGDTLRDWRDSRERTWDEILAVFVAAGRGLAAAHRAGLVHRDFKPDNVLIGKEGTVRVTDFGLARLAKVGEEAGATAPECPIAEPGPDDLWRLTRTGAVIGTPAYMAPEQHLGRSADALSDQFSFCVALHEAAYGKRPFEGRTLSELRDAVVEGRPRSPGPPRGMPAGLTRTLERGLSPDPAARFPSMDLLLAELTGAPRQRRRRVTAAVGVVAVASLVAVAAWWSRGASPVDRPCTGAGDHLAQIWNAERKRAIRDAFAATGVVYAGASWTRVVPVADDYAGGWIAAHTEACRATRVLGEQSEAALDLRMQCLASRRLELGAFVDLLAAADASVVERAVQAAHSLRPTTDCADVEALARPVARPSDPLTSTRLAELESELARAAALAGAGRWREALDATRPLVARARALGHAPFLAEALEQLGNLENATGDERAAERTLKDAILAAEAGRDDARRARGLIRVASVVADPTRLEEATELINHAQAIVGRLHDRRLVAVLERTKGNIAVKASKLDEGRRHLERALAEDEATLAPGDPRVTLTRVELGYLLERLGEYDDAERHLERARADYEKSLGSDHPLTARVYANLASLANSRGEPEEALRLLDRVVDIRLRMLGEGNQATPLAFYERGQTLRGLGRLDRAQADLERALRLVRAMPDPDEGLLALCLDELGTLADDRGQHDKGLDLHRRALAIHRRRGDRWNIAPALYSVGFSLLRKRELEQALVNFEEALSVWESVLGPDHPDVAYALHGIGLVHNRAGRSRRAIAPLERAYRLWGGASAHWGAEATIALAHALWGTRRDPRAIELTREAADFWRKDPRYADELAEAEAWLARRQR